MITYLEVSGRGSVLVMVVCLLKVEEKGSDRSESCRGGRLTTRLKGRSLTEVVKILKYVYLVCHT